MANFQIVPDWQSWENQGANAVIADLSRNGGADLIVLRIDSPTPGPNRAFYRVGRGLDAQGQVRGGWGPWQEIPNWQAFANEGGGVCVADFGSSLALVVFQIQHFVPGPNRGMFKIGRQLDPQGNVTGGWSDWQAVPDWRSWRDQGAAVACADLDGDGVPELVVFHIDDFHTDNPAHPNKGFYRVGRHLAADGSVQGWSDWIEVDWFSWFNQGAGLAIADLDGNGSPELIVFQIDDPPGENAGFYRVGWNLDASGHVQDGYGPWVRIDGWGSFEDQGGGLSLVRLGQGRPSALVFHVDNPPGLNEGRFAVVPLTLDIDNAARLGVWRLLPYFSEVLPVHAGLLHTGKVLFFAGSGNNVFRFNAPDFGNVADGLYTSVVWDPQNRVAGPNTFQHPATQRRADAQQSLIDYFCCGHTLLADGRVLVVGGTLAYDKILVNQQMEDGPHGFEGTRDAVVFSPSSGQWNSSRPMARGRWYPTVVQRSDGSVVACSGLDENSQDNRLIEQNTNIDTASWTTARPDFGLPLYPHLFELTNGKLFFTGGKMDTEGDSQPFVFDPLAATDAALIAGLEAVAQCNQCASVILPPVQDQRFMILGGGPEDDTPDRGQATTRVAIVDFKEAQPRYRTVNPLRHERMHVNAVLLPDRTVLAVGGGVTREASAATAVVDPQGGREVFEAEVYDPATGSWSDTAPATIARLYHSVALLLPDGRVVAAGGNPTKGSQVPWLPPDPFEEMRLEIFSPPYLFKGARPVIAAAPTEIGYGTTMAIKVAGANALKWLSLIRPGLTTHSFNVTQRVVDLPFDAVGNSFNAHVPADRHMAPPGWYMLFATDTAGVPSVATWQHLS